MDTQCIQLPAWWYWALLLAYAGLECFLGKTKRTEAGSMVELVIIVIVSVCVFVVSKLKKKEIENEIRN